MILNCPVPLVTAVRNPSINAGLDASTVTPGKTLPDESFTTPTIALCAKPLAATPKRQTSTKTTRITVRAPCEAIVLSPVEVNDNIRINPTAGSVMIADDVRRANLAVLSLENGEDGL